jgi:hypothetical protein
MILIARGKNVDSGIPHRLATFSSVGLGPLQCYESIQS